LVSLLITLLHVPIKIPAESSTAISPNKMSTRTKRGAAAAATEEPAAKKTKEEQEEETPVVAETPAEDVKSKPSLASQVDLSDKNPTDPNAFNDFLFGLLAHKADTNNYHVSRDDNGALHMWMQHIKREYKQYLSGESGSSLTDVQVRVLESLHVPLTSRGDDHWNRFYQLLQAYGDRHGHVLVPRLCEVPGLGDWVTDQRRQYKAWKQGQASQLTKERRDKLEAIGYVSILYNIHSSQHVHHVICLFSLCFSNPIT
jgi:hypothetical protein